MTGPYGHEHCNADTLLDAVALTLPKVKTYKTGRRGGLAGWTRMLKQNPTTGIYLLLHELFREGFRSFEDKLSSENIMNWHAFGVQMKPTTGISARRANY